MRNKLFKKVISFRTEMIEVAYPLDGICPCRLKVVNEQKVNLQAEELFSELLRLGNGLFIGERHSILNNKEFLIQAIPFLKKLGVEIVFIELPQTWQPMIDSHMENGDNIEEVVEALLEIFREYHTPVYYYDKYVEILDVAREHGIKIVCIDIERDEAEIASIISRKPNLTKSNEAWVRRITEYLASHRGKYVVYGGMDHVAGKKGVSKQLDIRSINLQTGEPRIIRGQGDYGDYIIFLERSKKEPPLYKDKWEVGGLAGEERIVEVEIGGELIRLQINDMRELLFGMGIKFLDYGHAIVIPQFTEHEKKVADVLERIAERRRRELFRTIRKRV